MGKITQEQDSRRVFIDSLMILAKNDPSVVLICCDTGFNYLEKFSEAFPKQFFNFGVTEQSSMIIAATMALSGFKSYIYSMINFMVMRPYEMVRNAVCMHNANVKIIGVKGSEKYKFLGFSHNMIHDNEDVYLLKDLPNMRIYIPKTNIEVEQAICDSYNNSNPAYIRL